jgi:hypothetical protein
LEGADNVLRARDDLSGHDNSNALWGFAIRSAQELEGMPRDRLDDPVLFRLFRMGLFDWTGPSKVVDAVVQSIRYAATTGSRLLRRILLVEEKVFPFSVRMLIAD